MKVILQTLAIAVLIFAATAVETRASERLDVNPPPLLEQVSLNQLCELTAHVTILPDAAPCGANQFFVIPCNVSVNLLRLSPEATQWAIAGPRQFAAMSMDDYKMLVLAERPPRLCQYLFSRTLSKSFANAR